MSDGSGTQASSRRDFGDSAGYGGGGSTRDVRDVLGEDAARPRGPNPLDAVMTIPPHARRRDRSDVARHAPDPGRDPSAELVLAAGAMLAACIGFLAWRYAQDSWADRRRSQRRRRLREDGASREALARYQV